MPKKSNQSAFPNSPIYFWQLLRRNKWYQAAVEEFLSVSKECGDKPSIELFEGIKGNGRLANLLAGDGRLSCLNDTSSMNAVSTQTLAEELYFGVQLRDYIFGEADVDFRQGHLQNFLDRFGDIVKFPIDPSIEKPSLAALAALWAYRPIVIEYLSPEGFRSPQNLGPSKMGLNINRDFPDKQILAEFRSILDVIRNSEKRGRFERQKVKWHEFTDYLEVWDLRQSGKGLSTIGKMLWPDQRFSKHSEDPRKKRAQNYFVYAKQLISKFDR
jgi:hypothetical protein